MPPIRSDVTRGSVALPAARNPADHARVFIRIPFCFNRHDACPATTAGKLEQVGSTAKHQPA